MSEPEFWSVMYSRGDGSPLSILPPSNSWVPDTVDYDLNDDYSDQLGPWVPVTGRSGQHGYSGPLMHPSEMFAGGLEHWVKNYPGVYTLVPVDDPEDDEPVGWMLLHQPLESDSAESEQEDEP